MKKIKKNIKKFPKKIYFKNINIKNLKIQILNILKKKFKYTKKIKKYILSDKGVYILKNNIFSNYDITTNILNETSDLIEINEHYKYKKNIFQIPYQHKLITINEISFNIDNNLLIFEIIENKINDFFIKSFNSLSILDKLMIQEISYIKNLII